MPDRDLMETTHSLVQELGPKWKKIVSALNDKGFRKDDGTPLTIDTVRKRYKRWLRESGTDPQPGQRQAPKEQPRQETTGPKPTDPRDESSEKSEHAGEAVIPVSELIDLFRGSIERRDAMLAEKVKSDSYARESEEYLRTIEARLEERLLKHLKEELLGVIQDAVDEELKNMLTPGGSFTRDLKSLIATLIDEKAKVHLVSLLGDIDISHDRPAGPGRGYKGKKVARFSATMDKDTYQRMKNLPGTFSSRLTSACLLYLSALESEREHTD